MEREFDGADRQSHGQKAVNKNKKKTRDIQSSRAAASKEERDNHLVCRSDRQTD